MSSDRSDGFDEEPRLTIVDTNSLPPMSEVMRYGDDDDGAILGASAGCAYADAGIFEMSPFPPINYL